MFYLNLMRQAHHLSKYAPIAVRGLAGVIERKIIITFTEKVSSDSGYDSDAEYDPSAAIETVKEFVFHATVANDDRRMFPEVVINAFDLLSRNADVEITGDMKIGDINILGRDPVDNLD